MKKLLTGLIVIFIVGILWFFKANRQILVSDSSTLPTPRLNQAKKINYKNEKYIYYIEILETRQPIMLINNLMSKFSSNQLMTKYGCRIGFNGGFYDTQDKSLGLMISNGEIVARERTSKLFNGFIYINPENNFKIVKDISDQKELGMAGQTGPVLIDASRPIRLALTTDKLARRMFLIEFDNNLQHAAVGAVYRENSTLDGPLLAELPEIILAISQNEKWNNVFMAINLDGGSASALKTPEFNIDEWSTVGSWWCIK